tara:strand:- start:437 stop:1630 length:1194 start_codon:yes stop_codon:yes gene_type:complete
MKKYILLALLFTLNIDAQFFKKTYDNIFKYATIYVAADMREAYETKYPDYFIRTNPDDLYAIPDVIDETIYHPFDYRAGVGIRKLARYDYEIKQNYIDGTENMIGISAPTGAVKGFEYLFHYEKERERGEEFDNTRFFLRHTGKYHIVKLESRKQGNVDFQYQSAEVRFRLPIGRKLSFSIGAIARSHEKAYGYNPIEIWLNETMTYIDSNTGEERELVINNWWELGYLFGFEDEFTEYKNLSDGTSFYDYIWRDENANIVAYGDRDFRDRIYGGLMNRFNEERWNLLDPFMEVAPIVGFDFYHYRPKFWLHAYANCILPYHHYFKGDEDVSYLNRNNFGKRGLKKDSQLEQFTDYQGGLIVGLKITKTLGLFLEGEYIKFWDSEIINSSVGLNFRL